MTLFYIRTLMDTIKAIVGVLRNQAGQLLIAKRQKHQFMAGFWELPGGKIKNNESNQNAISRELFEELGIQTNKISPHQTMLYQYPERQVSLSIYNIDDYSNTPQSMEGQAIAWVDIGDLHNYKLLPTMRAFIASITLPDKYWITSNENHQSAKWMNAFEQHLNAGIKLIQLRSKVSLNRDFTQQLHRKCQQYHTKLLLNIPHKNFDENAYDGWHLTTCETLKLNQRPCDNKQLLGASAHNLQEALKAQTIGADFVVISPVQTTPTHPNRPPIGWKTAKTVVDTLNIPVYFLGGMQSQDTPKALHLGAQGIAGVSAILKKTIGRF